MIFKVLLLGAIFLSKGLVFASGSFIVKEKEQIIYQEGDLDKPYAPCSTFKIALSLIGYDSGILENEMSPVWKFQDGYVDFLPVWKQDQTPKSWMKNSCVWYSQVLTKELGLQKFRDYVVRLNYGNMDISGDKGKDNGLINSWLSSSLEISSLEQMAFLEKLLAGALPVSGYSHQMTRKILFIENLKNGWKLYGKTGSGYLLNEDRTQKLEIKHGWFVGWIEKEDRKIVFVNHITDDKKEDTHAGLRAKDDAKERLVKIIDQVEGNHL